MCGCVIGTAGLLVGLSAVLLLAKVPVWLALAPIWVPVLGLIIAGFLFLNSFKEKKRHGTDEVGPPHN